MLNIKELTLDQIPTYIFWKDTKSIFIGCNNFFTQIAGLNISNAIIGMSDFDLPWAEIGAVKYRKDDHEVVEGKSKLNYFEVLQEANGTLVNTLISKTQLRDSKNNIIGVLGAFQIASVFGMQEKSAAVKQNLPLISAHAIQQRLNSSVSAIN